MPDIPLSPSRSGRSRSPARQFGAARSHSADIRFDAVILAGGASRRLGGVDKPALVVGGRTLLARAVDACAEAAHTVVVGPTRAVPRPVVQVREQPPGAGPVAALAAALPRLRSAVVVLLAADLPFVTGRTVTDLVVTLAETTDGSAVVDGVVPVDEEGREQTLCAAYRTDALRAAISRLDTVAGASLRRLLAPLRLRRVADTADAAFDCDTWAQVRTARRRSGTMSERMETVDVLEDWIAALKAELGVDLDVDVAALLDMTKTAAHNVARPAAPLTSFLVGYAAAQAGGGADQVARVLDQAERFAADYRRSDKPHH